jgi:hypothetical protein
MGIDSDHTRGGDMTTFGMNGMYETDLAGEALDLDGATVDPSAEADAEHVDTDGTPVGAADADAAPN